MADLNLKTENASSKIDQFEERLKNRFSTKGNSLLGKNMEYSNLFEKNNSLSESFSVLKIKFERATLREASSFNHSPADEHAKAPHKQRSRPHLQFL